VTRPAEGPPPTAPVRAALMEGWPLIVSALVIGAPFGIVARQAGIGLAETVGMSVIMFGGAAQFAAVELARTGGGTLLVVAVTFLLNLRHLLMAAALRPFVGGQPLARRLALGYLLTDEAFAMAIGWFRRGRREIAYYVAFGTALWVCWNVATVAGSLAGGGIAEPRGLGIDFAITASFVSIVLLSVRTRADAVVAAVAAGAAAALSVAGASVVAVVVAGALAPAVVFLPARGRAGEGR
jgi:predicted branched-subunit amino acid permease